MCDICWRDDDLRPFLYDIQGLLEIKELKFHWDNKLVDLRSSCSSVTWGTFTAAESHHVDVTAFQSLCEKYCDYCWSCIRDLVQETMQWNFDFLDYGIYLFEHQKYSDFFEELTHLSESWNERIRTLLLSDARGIEWVHTSDRHFNELLVEVVDNEIDAEMFSRVTNYLALRCENSHLNSVNDLLFLTLSRGYRSEEELDLLWDDGFQEEIEELKYFDFMPYSSLLKVTGGYQNYRLYREVSLKFSDDDDHDTESKNVLRFIELGVPIEKLLQLSGEFMSGINDEFDEALVEDWSDLENVIETDWLEGFLSTLRVMTRINMTPDIKNLCRYWEMSEHAVLRAVDTGETNMNFFRASRLFDDAVKIEIATHLLDNGEAIRDVFVLVSQGLTVELSSACGALGVSLHNLITVLDQEKNFPLDQILHWLGAGFNAESIDEMFEWWRCGFAPEDLVSWRQAGFQPLAAQAWARRTDDPAIAMRRQQAGISPT